MSSDIKRTIFNTRERVLSTDQNTATDLFHRALIEQLAAATGRQTGVVHGLEVSVPASGLDVTVSPGLALFDLGTATGSDSEYAWIELISSETVTLPAADATNPRWDVIEIAANDVVELSSLRDVFNPSTGTFAPQTVEKRRGSDPLITVRSGTAAATPVFPAGTTGVIPLAYVYVPALAATLTAGDEVRCRPIIRTPDEPFVQGGGVNADRAPNSLVLEHARGRFDGANVTWVVPRGTAIDPDLTASWAGGSTWPAAAEANYYVYAIPPVYPTGYESTLATREFVPGSSAEARFANPTSGVKNCRVLVSQSAPNDLDMFGAPAAAADTFNEGLGFGSVSTAREDWHYLGAFQSRDTNTIRPQEYTGADAYFSGGVSNNYPSVTITYAGTQSLDLDTFDTVGLPLSTTRVYAYFRVTGTNPDVSLLLTADLIGVDRFWRVNHTGGTGFPGMETEVPTVAGTRTFQIEGTVIGGAGVSGTFTINGFQDRILALR